MNIHQMSLVSHLNIQTTNDHQLIHQLIRISIRADPVMRLLLPSSAVFPSPSSSVSDPSVVPRPQILFRRRPPPDAEARPPVRPDPVSRPAPRPRPQEDDARPVRAHAAPPGLMKATTQPESEPLGEARREATRHRRSVSGVMVLWLKHVEAQHGAAGCWC